MFALAVHKTLLKLVNLSFILVFYSGTWVLKIYNNLISKFNGFQILTIWFYAYVHVQNCLISLKPKFSLLLQCSQLERFTKGSWNQPMMDSSIRDELIFSKLKRILCLFFAKPRPGYTINHTYKWKGQIAHTAYRWNLDHKVCTSKSVYL